MSLSGLMMNLLSPPTAKVISDLVTVRYTNFSINLLCLTGSSSVWLSSNHKFTLASIGVLADLHPKSPVSSRRSKTYFHWEKNTLCFWCATLIPRKYLGLPMSLVIKWRLRYSVSNSPVESLLVSKMSSTYTTRTTMPEFVCRVKTEWSEWH